MVRAGLRSERDYDKRRCTRDVARKVRHRDDLSNWPHDVNTKPKARERILGDDELRKVWKVADGEFYPFGASIAAFIATALREAVRRRDRRRGLRVRIVEDGEVPRCRQTPFAALPSMRSDAFGYMAIGYEEPPANSSHPHASALTGRTESRSTLPDANNIRRQQHEDWPKDGFHPSRLSDDRSRERRGHRTR